MDGGEVQLNPLFVFKEAEEKDGRIEGTWEFISPIRRRMKLKQSGYEEPMRLIEELEKR